MPSTALLSRFTPFKIAGYLTDWVMHRLYPDFKRLPPNHLRVRVGVRNRLFLNQVACLSSGTNYWLQAFALGDCRLDSNILELGCGYGRKAMTLRDFFVQGRRFEGRYVGIDIDPELLAFAERSFPSDRFRFLRSPHVSRTYQPDSQSPPGRAPARGGELFGEEIPGASQDFVFSTSLFTHLLEPELRDYLRLAHRALRPGGVMLMNYFCLDHLREHRLLGDRWSFRHRRGPAFIESERYPEAAVGFEREFMEGLCRDLGFFEVRTITDGTGTARQSHLRCRR